MAAICWSEREHAIEAFEALKPPLAISLQDNFSIACRRERVAHGLKLTTQFAIVVDFAVKYNPQLSRRVGHGLTSPWRKVKDRQPAMTKTERTVQIKAAVIRPAAAKRISCADQRCLFDRRAIKIEASNDPAHIRS